MTDRRKGGVRDERNREDEKERGWREQRESDREKVEKGGEG